jgi:hypothetical protein
VCRKGQPFNLCPEEIESRLCVGWAGRSTDDSPAHHGQRHGEPIQLTLVLGLSQRLEIVVVRFGRIATLLILVIGFVAVSLHGPDTGLVVPAGKRHDHGKRDRRRT